MNANEEVRVFMTDPVLQQRIAKYLVLQCFRNSVLEDLHAGISPSSASGDYSDVSVSSPHGVIPWPNVSRLNDDEMKRLMIDVVDRAYRFTSFTRCSTKAPAANFCSAWRNVIHCRSGKLPSFRLAIGQTRGRIRKL